MEHFEQSVRKVMPSIRKGTVGLVEMSPVEWSQIGGLSEVKGQIQQVSGLKDWFCCLLQNCYNGFYMLAYEFACSVKKKIKSNIFFGFKIHKDVNANSLKSFNDRY